MLTSASETRPGLPFDRATSMAILADRFGGMAEAEGYASGATLPSGLSPGALAGLNHVSAAAPSATSGRSAGLALGRLAATAATEGPLSPANVLAVANAVMQTAQGWSERSQLDDAFAKLHLDRNDPRQVLAANAYVWVHHFGPWAVRGVPLAGDSGGVNERFARALSRYERSHPGTVFLATRRHMPSLSAIQTVADAARGGFGVTEPPITILDRRSAVSPKLSAWGRTARKTVGIQGNGHWQAHHVIPFAVVAALPIPVQQAIAASGWTMNSADNVIALPADDPTYRNFPNLTALPEHNTRHDRYSRDVAAALAPVAATATTVSPATLLGQLQTLDLRFKYALARNRRDYHQRLR